MRLDRVAPGWVIVTLLGVAALRCTRLEPGTDRFAAAGGRSGSSSGGANTLGGSGGSSGGSGGTLGGSIASGGAAAGTGGSTDGENDPGGAGSGGDGGCPPEDERDLVRIPAEPGEHELVENTLWTCEHDYLLNGSVLVTPDTTLTIAAGTRIRAATGSVLLAMRRARIEILGSAEEPVVFTSDRPEGERAPGDWRGIVLIGDAPSHAANVQVYNTLGDHRADYGGGPGGSSTGSCGIVRYARIEFAGGDLGEFASPGAALTFAGCGAGTVVDHVQVHRPTDGIGIYGGTLPLRRVLVTGSSRGDGIEWTGGYTGSIQFAIVQSLGGAAGMLGSNSEADPERLPVSAPEIFNATLVGTPPLVAGYHFGFLLQFGSFATLKNSIIYGFADAAFHLRLSSAVLSSEVGPGRGVDISHVLMHGNLVAYTVEAQVLETMASMRLADPGLEAALLRFSPSFLPTDDDVLIEPEVAMPPFDTTATYRGAISPAGPDWTNGWTSFPER